MADFKVNDTIIKGNTGVLLTGINLDKKEISVGDFISIPYGKYKIDIQIIDIVSSFNESSENNQLGLLISNEDFNKIQDYNLDIESINIKIPIRGLDVQLAASYGIGVKWWAGPLLLLIIIVIALIYYLIAP